MKDIKDIFPKASQSFIKANPLSLLDDNEKTPPRPPAGSPRGVMNKTEQAFALRLEAMKRAAEILRYEFEPLRLRWGDSMFYKPDFLVVTHSHDEVAKLIEVKGAHVWDRDLVRFKGCRAEWKDCFTFELWQRQKGGIWKQIL